MLLQYAIKKTVDYSAKTFARNVGRRVAEQLAVEYVVKKVKKSIKTQKRVHTGRCKKNCMVRV